MNDAFWWPIEVMRMKYPSLDLDQRVLDEVKYLLRLDKLVAEDGNTGYIVQRQPYYVAVYAWLAGNPDVLSLGEALEKYKEWSAPIQERRRTDPPKHHMFEYIYHCFYNRHHGPVCTPPVSESPLASFIEELKTPDIYEGYRAWLAQLGYTWEQGGFAVDSYFNSVWTTLYNHGGAEGVT
tara:strand:- start:112 stop:651 length:540 start_codon:yes stop_codon:yes gene_type:complete